MIIRCWKSEKIGAFFFIVDKLSVALISVIFYLQMPHSRLRLTIITASQQNKTHIKLTWKYFFLGWKEILTVLFNISKIALLISPQIFKKCSNKAIKRRPRCFSDIDNNSYIRYQKASTEFYIFYCLIWNCLSYLKRTPKLVRSFRSFCYLPKSLMPGSIQLLWRILSFVFSLRFSQFFIILERWRRLSLLLSSFIIRTIQG